jgi:hemolysin D
VPRDSAATLTLKQYQSETDAIREAAIPTGPRIAIWLLTGLFTSCLLVTMLVPVDRVVNSTSGKVVPTQAVSVFQALDPSIIKSIRVKEGEVVRSGQVLATLDQTFAVADVTQLRQQIASLDAQITRAEAELSGKTPGFSHVPDPDHERYEAIQQQLFLQRAAQYKAQVNSYDEKIRQTQATIAKLKNDESRYSEREKISKQIEDMHATLTQRQVDSVLDLLNAQDQRLEMIRTVENDQNSLVEAQYQLASLQSDSRAFQEQWAAATSQELVTTRNARDAAVSQLSKAIKHQDLVQLTSSDDAVVLTVAKLSVGSVLKAGDTLLTLMPLKTPVEAEIDVSSRDVGFLRTNDPATIKIDAFNSVEHGTADGRVRWISDGAFTTDENGQPVPPYYKARVSIEAFHFSGVPANFRLIPGMTLTADIKVGRRSLARYIIGGALNGFSESMREP